MTTLAHVASLAGVTTATVSRVLSGSPRISQQTRSRVLDIVAQHDFRLNQTARNLRLGRTGLIGVVVPLGHQSAQRVSDPFYTALIGQLMDGLMRREHAMVLSAVEPHDETWLSTMARSGRVDGIIVLCQSDQDEVLRATSRSYRPMVVWGEAEGESYCCVGTDNRLGGRIATEHLLRSGRRQVAYLGMTDTPELIARHKGYLDAHRAAGMEPGPLLAVPLSEEAALPAGAVARLAEDGGVDGVVAASDVVAMSVIRALAALGRTVPDDVAVVGYDDVSLAAHTVPALTTIRQDLPTAASVMLDLLFRRIAGEDTASAQLPLELVRRASA